MALAATSGVTAMCVYPVQLLFVITTVYLTQKLIEHRDAALLHWLWKERRTRGLVYGDSVALSDSDVVVSGPNEVAPLSSREEELPAVTIV